ncbi:MAG: DinB family protein [Planctomycetota bacterium]|nr:DinB family protein [Planctomycetota bacterium]
MERMRSQLRWVHAYAHALADVPDALWTQPGPAGLENHAAWTLGHVISGIDMTAEDVGLERDLPDGWQDLFERRGPGDPRLPEPDAGAYPSRDALLDELDRQVTRIDKALETCDRAPFGERIEWRFDGSLPTLGDAVAFMLVTHVAMHLGQLAAWRRHHGLPSALAAMDR